ncbi:uncharacterized protein [Haliotis cracherodii]|uniref:uncharacterized protein n=1 Tax=Haliotis cracherodii TaxID=6455 RepID=UPI0039E8D18D
MQMYRMASDVSRSTCPVYSSTIRTHVTMKQSVDITTFIYLLILFYNMNGGYCSTAELTCPDLAYIEKFAVINCLTSEPFTSLQYLGPGGFLGPQCSSTICIDADGYNASVTNKTSSSLRILNVQPGHAGQWKCNILQHGPSASCTLVIAKTPNCNITSKEDTDVLSQYQALTLTVDIQDYYCSTALNFSLQTGNVTTLLTKADFVANVTHNTSSVTLNVTDSHLGIVGLVFSCHNYKWNLTCEGVTKLETKTAAVPGNVGLTTASTLIIAACVVVAIVCFIIVVIIIAFVVKRKQVTRIKPQSSLKPSSPPYITVGTPGGSDYATVELNDAPSGSKIITVIDAAGCACTGDFKAKNRSCSLTKDESNEISLPATSTDNPKNHLSVVVQHIIPEDTSQINELYASINKTKDMAVHNDDTAI